MPRLVIFVFLFLSVTLCLGADTSIRIGTANNIRYEHETQIAITLDNQSGFFEMGGFDLLLTYSSSLTLQNVVMGSMLSDCAWEYYTTQTVGTNSLRLVAIAETINGPIHPSCFGTGNNDTLAVLTFQVSQYQALGCEFLPIYWNWYDCGDNAVSSVTGDTLFISDTVYESNGADDFPVGDNPTFPTPSGAPDECLPSLRGIDFYGGGIYALYRDLNKPQVVCPENIEVNIDSNECGSWVTFSAEVEDNCPGAIHYCIPPSGSFFTAGTTPVTCIGRDYSGNADTCSFVVQVDDTIAPVLTVPGDTTVGSYPGLCGTAIGFEASATDNCYAATVYCHPPSGSFIPVGVKTVTCLAVDIAGNTDSTQFTITVEDTEPPELLLPEDITALNDPGQCGALVSYEVDVTDNCSGATMACSPVSGYYFEVGITSVTCIGLDTQGNADTGIFLITVVDTTPPVINCPSDMHVANFPDQCGAPVDFNIEAADNCSDVTVTTFPESGSFFEKGETPVKILAVDDAGNKDSCEFIISVHDYEPPQAICPEDMTVFNDSGLYAAIVDFEISGTDNCPGVTASAVPPTGSIFNTGTTQVRTVALDAAGNADTSYFNIEVMLNDPDDDGRPDWDDNCPALSNPDQADIDEDGYGNVCDSCTDIDGDGYGDPGYAANICEIDNCPAVYNLDQNDTDSDGFGNVCDICPGYDDAADGDGDGVPDGCDYVYGDSNGDSQINVGDAVHMISYIFKGGSAPDPIEAGDANCDNQLNVGDAVFLISHVFKGGPAPDCGPPR